MLRLQNRFLQDATDILGQFPNHDIHYKITPGAIKARIMTMVKKVTVNISRLSNIEESAMSCMLFKIKTQAITFVLTAWYRQWEHPELIKPYNTNGVIVEVERLESFQRQIKKAKCISSNIIITWDINIDMLEDRDQISISRLCRTMPIYRKIMEDYGQCVMNKKQPGFVETKRAWLIIYQPIFTKTLRTSPPLHQGSLPMVWWFSI